MGRKKPRRKNPNRARRNISKQKKPNNKEKAGFWTRNKIIGVLGAGIVLALSYATCDKEKPQRHDSSKKPAGISKQLTGNNPTLPPYKERFEGIIKPTKPVATPSVEFMPVDSALPELPEGVNEADIDKIANQLFQSLKDYLQEAKQDPGNIDNYRKGVLNKAVNTLVGSNVAFAQFINQRESKFKSNLNLLTEYINQFLLQAGHYLFTEFNRTNTVDLHKVIEHGQVVINGKKTGTYVVMNEGFLDKYSRIDAAGIVDPAAPTIVNLWPHRFKSLFDSYKKETGKEDISDFINATYEGFKYHESVHIYLESQYPTTSLPKSMYIGGLRFAVKEGLNLDLASRYQTEDIHEICAVGAELAKTTNAHQILKYTLNDTPAYQFARKVLLFSALKHMPPSSPVRQKNVATLESEATTLSPGEIHDYFLQTDNLELVHKIGQDMYNYGLSIIKTLGTQRR